MLFGYSPDAFANNWLHEAMVAIVTAVHEAADTGHPMQGWPAIVPPEHREALQRRKTLPTLLQAYHTAYCSITNAERTALRQALVDQNRVRELLSSAVDCVCLDDLPEAMRKPTHDLFEHAFELLTDLELRDEAYRAVYLALDRKDCPFCGVEPLSAPGGRREDADHYLAKSKYPYAAANLENLPPMGHRCNTIKTDKDILHWAEGDRRTAFYPFEARHVAVVLRGSVPFQGPDRGPKWAVDFEPDSPEVETWIDVFDIRERYVRDDLTPHFDQWVKSFGRHLRESSADEVPTDEAVVAALRTYVRRLQNDALTGRDSLRLPVFFWLLDLCQGGHRRMSRFLARSAPPLPLAA